MIASPMTRSVSGSRRAGREQAGTRRGCPCPPVRVALAGHGRCARPAARLRMPAPGALFGDRHGQVARARQGSGSSGVACRGGSHVRPGRRAHPDSQADRSRPGGRALGASCLGGGVRRRRAGLALLGRRTDGGRDARASRFSLGYKEQSVVRLSELGARHSSAAAESGVTPTQLKTWRFELEAPGSAAATAAPKPSLSALSLPGFGGSGPPAGDLRQLGTLRMHDAVEAEIQVGLVHLEEFLQQGFQLVVFLAHLIFVCCRWLMLPTTTRPSRAFSYHLRS